MPLTMRSLHHIGDRADQNGVSVQKLVDAGAIVLCVTNTPEFCFYWESTNKTMKTCNPYNTSRSSAGSSSGNSSRTAGSKSSVKRTGLSTKVIIDFRDPSVRPRISIKDENAKTVKLPSKVPIKSCWIPTAFTLSFGLTNPVVSWRINKYLIC